MQAIPLVAGAIISHFSGGKSSQQADMASQQQSALARQLSDFSQKQFSLAQPAYSQALKYYSTLTGGNRAAINTTLAPQYAQIGDMYKGAETATNARMAPGAQRENALAELYRSKAGALSLLPMQARTSAVGQLGTMGSQGMQSGVSGLSAAGNVYSNLYSQAREKQLQSQQQSGAMGSAIFKIFGDWISQKYGGGDGGGSSYSDMFSKLSK